jgi:hypothetical protein
MKPETEVEDNKQKAGNKKEKGQAGSCGKCKK